MSQVGVSSVIKAERVQSRLTELRGWRLSSDGNALERAYDLPSFRAAVGFVAYVGELAEALQHHPDIDLRYRTVTLRTTTHDAGGITEKDFELIAQVDRL